MRPGRGVWDACAATSVFAEQAPIAMDAPRGQTLGEVECPESDLFLTKHTKITKGGVGDSSP